MESSRTVTSGGGKTAGGRSKTPGIPASNRLQRNIAEKERRDKLNGFISELATLIPMVSNASKPLDKVSILRLAASEMRLHFSCLNPKKYKKKPLVLPPIIMSSLDLIEKTMGGFVMVTTLTGLIIFCSRSIEDYLGYQNIDVMGNKVAKYIYEDDVKFFESKVSSVVRSLKKARKKTKVIKAHMLQKPLPRSTETCRPRNMIFKISVHQNDTSGENGLNNNGSSQTKTRPQKDFGYTAVVLLFIEPVRFEPEIDITYIDTNQDAYFTRHGLQGEIIYTDQCISTVTGYMPHDVQGTSAYQYICSSDVPIALFAQKAMFTSPDGKGVIVYRLRIRDMRYIYLQSSGQIAYKESTSEISHFVCFNRLLSEEEGSQELKKFQQRYAPQIMAAKMLQVKQNPGSMSPTTDLAFEQVMKLMNASPTSDVACTSGQATSSAASTILTPDACSAKMLQAKQNPGCTSPTTDLVFEQVMKLMNASPTNDVACTAGQTTSFSTSTILTPDTCSGTADQKASETIVSPSSLPIEPNFAHSSGGHSTISPVDTARSPSMTLNCTPSYVKDDHIDAILDRPEQRLGGGPLRRTDCSSAFLSNPYKSVTNDRKGKILFPEQYRNSVDKLDSAEVNEQVCNSVNNPNIYDGTHRIHQNRQYISIKSQNGTVHFVNVNDNVFNGANVNGPHEDQNNQSMVFEPTLPQKITFQLAASVPRQNDIPDVNEQLREYLRREDSVSINNSQISGSFETVPGICDQLNLYEEQSQASQVSHIEDSSFSRIHHTSSVPSLMKMSNVSAHSHLYNGVDYSHNLNSYPQIDNFNYSHLISSISNSNDGANVSAYNDLDDFDSNLFNSGGMNGFHETVAPLDEPITISPMEIFDSTKISIKETANSVIPENTAQNKVIFMDANISGMENDKMEETVNQSSTLSAFLSNNEDKFSDSVGKNEILSLDPIGSEELPLAKELYSELESFFCSNRAATVIKRDTELPLDIRNYLYNRI